MKKTIKLNSSVEIDLENLLRSKALLQANSGGGKSWLIRRILEQSHGKVQQIVIDPEGEFSTLREKFDYILAGKGGDTPADPRSAALLARKLLELNVSAIVDLYELPPQERKHFVRLFIDALVNAPKELWHDVLIVIDEAHVFVPEKDESEAAGPINDLASRGRKRGFGLILATQRISKLAKDSAAECNNKLIGRTSLDIDMKRAGEELGMTSREDIFSLRKLTPGNFLAFGPAISDEVIEVRVGDVQTSHPKAGSQASAKVAPPTAGIRKILGRLADLPKEAEEEKRTIAGYKGEVALLKRKITELEKDHKPVQVKLQKITIPMVGKKTLEGLKTAESSFRKMARGMRESASIIDAAVDKLAAAIDKATRAQNDTEPRQENGRGTIHLVMDKKNPDIMAQGGHGGVSSDDRIWMRDPLSGPEQRIINAIRWFETIGIIDPEQTAVAFLAGYTYGGGGFNNPRGALRVKGLLEYRGNRLALTSAGRSIAEAPMTPLDTKALHDHVLRVLPGPEAKLLKVLLETYPEEISKDSLAEKTGYAPGSGGFNNPCGRLRTLGLVEYPRPGTVKAKDLLFIG